MCIRDSSYIVLGDETTTIIDVGFNHPACEKALDKALESLGRTWDTVEIVLTHSHPDHTGNLDRIYRDGMRVYANLHSFKEVELSLIHIYRYHVNEAQSMPPSCGYTPSHT